MEDFLLQWFHYIWLGVKFLFALWLTIVIGTLFILGTLEVIGLIKRN
jgi:hypothetical protein